jgi:hypothetical protein
MRKITIKKNRPKPLNLERRLRELFAMDRLYTIPDLIELTGHDEAYLRSKISMLQNQKYSGDPLVLKRQRCSDGLKRIGNLMAQQLCRMK